MLGQDSIVIFHLHLESIQTTFLQDLRMFPVNDVLGCGKSDTQNSLTGHLVLDQLEIIQTVSLYCQLYRPGYTSIPVSDKYFKNR